MILADHLACQSKLIAGNITEGNITPGIILNIDQFDVISL